MKDPCRIEKQFSFNFEGQEMDKLIQDIQAAADSMEFKTQKNDELSTYDWGLNYNNFFRAINVDPEDKSNVKIIVEAEKILAERFYNKFHEQLLRNEVLEKMIRRITESGATKEFEPGPSSNRAK